MRILLIEDDAEIASYILNRLAELSHVVEHVADGREGLILATTGSYDALVIDLMLPGLDGLGVLKTLRGAGVETPALILTARASVPDRVEGLNAGADDYLTKPFAFSELFARLNALTRRPPLVARETILKVADLEMDLVERQVTRGVKKLTFYPASSSSYDTSCKTPNGL
jgi:two-component system OmpR family response regulator